MARLKKGSEFFPLDFLCLFFSTYKKISYRHGRAYQDLSFSIPDIHFPSAGCSSLQPRRDVIGTVWARIGPAICSPFRAVFLVGSPTSSPPPLPTTRPYSPIPPSPYPPPLPHTNLPPPHPPLTFPPRPSHPFHLSSTPCRPHPPSPRPRPYPHPPPPP